jgi:ferredoxin
MVTSKRIVLHFPRRLIDQPIVYKLVKDFNLSFNILKASVTPEEESLMVLELTGEPRDYDTGVKYLTDQGVKIESLSQDVVRDESRCTHCGVCVTVCPTGAFTFEPVTRKVLFDQSKCAVCELCVKGCPPHAMELYFGR